MGCYTLILFSFPAPFYLPSPLSTPPSLPPLLHPSLPLPHFSLPPSTPLFSLHPSLSPPLPPYQTPQPIPQTGNRLQVPRQASLVFKNKVLKVVQSDQILRKFLDIRRLFFYTGFNGTRVFTTSAPVPLDEIFGGGK